MIDASLPYSEILARRASALGTLAVHAGDSMDRATRAIDTPIVLSSAFGFDSAEHAADAFQLKNDAYIYGRWGNPTVEALEAKLAALEGAEDACAAASGMAAISGTVMALCASGSHIVAPKSMYAESARLFRERLPRFGITTTFVDATDPESYARAITKDTRILYIETPANPNLAIGDIRAIVALARAHRGGDPGIDTVADNTFATPFAQTPLALGVDLVVHSMTKALGGHGDAIGGCVMGSKALLPAIRESVIKGFGGVIAPLTAYLVTRGLRTFALRQRQACETAALLAARLSENPRVAKVHHPSLKTHPGHERAKSQMHAYGALLSLELTGGGGLSAIDAGKRALSRVKIATHAVSLGDVKTLIVHPASTTHSTMPEPARREANITDGLLRISVGIESAEDLVKDLAQAIAD